MGARDAPNALTDMYGLQGGGSLAFTHRTGVLPVQQITLGCFKGSHAGGERKNVSGNYYNLLPAR